MTTHNNQCSNSKYVSVILWLCVLFLTTLFTLLFIMCFIHFLKQTHTPIVPNDLQDYSTTKSIYFLLSFYFLLWTVVYLGCVIFTVVRKKSGNHSEKPGKALLIVLLILLAIITTLLCTVDRLYSPWILNFLNGNIFKYCVQVSALITLTVTVCYVLSRGTYFLCSIKKKGFAMATNPAAGSARGATYTSSGSGGCGSVAVRMVEDTPLKRSFSNPCYNIEFNLLDHALILNGQSDVTQV